MDESTKLLIMDALQTWVQEREAMNQADRPVLSVGGGKAFSPRQIYLEIAEGTEYGHVFLSMIESGAKRESLEEVLRGFRNQWVASA